MIKEILAKFHNQVGEPIETEEQFSKIKKFDLSFEETQVMKLLRIKGFLNRKRYKEAKEVISEVTKSIDNKNYVSIEAFVFKYLSFIASSEGKYSDCLDYTQKYVEKADSSEPILFPARYHNLALAYLTKRQYNEAEENFLKSISYCEQYNLEKIKHNSFLGLGEFYLRQGLYTEAQEYLNKVIVYSKSVKDEVTLSKALNNYGLVLTNTGDYDTATLIFKELIYYSEKQQNVRLTGSSYFNLGLCYSFNEKYKKAERYYIRSMEILRPLNNLLLNKKIYNNLAMNYANLKRNDKVIHYYKKAYEITCKLGDDYNRRITRNNIINHLLDCDQFFPNMKQEIEDNISYFSKQNDIELLIISKNILSKYYCKKNNHKKALDLLRSAFTLQEDFFNKQFKEKNKEFYDTIKETIERREKIKIFLEPELQKRIKHNLIGASNSIRKVVEMAKKASSIETTNVLITGESGTGKEILSRLIHFNSKRKDKKLVTVNCSAITSTLAESEFFGHVQGSFTGASRDKIGFFEQANGGTLYLDEIGDMPLEIQSKILRAIEAGIITRVGDDKEIDVDVRIVASTNKDLDDLILHDKFRLDLLHRINVIHIKIPPLREREDDLELLAKHFIKQLSKSLNKRNIKFEESYIQKLKKYPFSGNIRELKNIIERSIILETTNVLTAESLPQIEVKERDQKIQQTTFNLSEVEKNTVLMALEKCNNSQKDAAKLLGLSESAVSRKLKKYRDNQ